jgi:glutamate dehydrogenase
VSEETGMGADDIARAYTVVRDIFNLRAVWKEIEALSGTISVEHQVELFSVVQNFVERVTIWFLTHLPQPMDVGKVVSEYKEGVQELAVKLPTLLSSESLEEYEAQFQYYEEKKLPEVLARKMAGVEILSTGCDIVRVAKNNNLAVDEVGRIYFEIGARLGLDWLKKALSASPVGSYWHKLSIKTMVRSISDQQIRLTAEVIKHMCLENKCDNPTESWVNKHFSQIKRFDVFMEELRSHEALDLSMLVVAAKKVESVCVV